MTTTTALATIERLQTMTPLARVKFLSTLSTDELGEIHSIRVGDAKPRTPKPVLERRVLESFTPKKEEGATTAEKPEKAPKPPKAKKTADATTDQKPPRMKDDRLPAVGTVLKKTDRSGAVRCEAVIEENGVSYKNKLYSSMSGAAMAAAADLGMKSKTQDGYAFWQLKKISRVVNHLEALGKVFARVSKKVKDAIDAPGDDAKKIKALLLKQSKTIEDLAGKLDD